MKLCTYSAAALCALAAMSAQPSAAGAQSLRIADSLLHAGQIARAESLYYDAVLHRPHDPAARSALGGYLATRGAPRVAATLYEEAIRFGGNRASLSRSLAPIYFDLGEYQDLLSLPVSPLSGAERQRVRWLTEHKSALVVADSLLMVTYRESADSEFVGHLPIRIDGHIVDAAISVTARGVILDDSNPLVARLHRFRTPIRGADGPQYVPAVADSIGIGQLSLMNEPVMVAPLAKHTAAVVGLDVLARFAPTFDPHTDHITLRANGRVGEGTAGSYEFSTVMTNSDLLIAQAGGLASVRTPDIKRLLAERRWTLDTRRGTLVLER
jgi:hypothetical protein